MTKLAVSGEMKLESLQELRVFLVESKIPVLLNPKTKGKIMLRFPNEEKHQAFVEAGQKSEPEWKPYGAWLVARSALRSHAQRCIGEWGSCWIVQSYREKEVCAPACQNALGLECHCSCMGLYHGHEAEASSGKWHVVNEAFCVRWGDVVYAVRRISAYEEALKPRPMPEPKPEPKKPVVAPWVPMPNSQQAQQLAARIRGEKEEALLRRKCAVDDFL